MKPNTRTIVLVILMILLTGVAGYLSYTLLFQDQAPEDSSAAAPNSDEEKYGENWTQSACESAGGVILDFEDYTGSGGSVAQDRYGYGPYYINIVPSHSGVSSNLPSTGYVARRGNQSGVPPADMSIGQVDGRQAFEGRSTQNYNVCAGSPSDWTASYRNDAPEPTGTKPSVGNYFLTDDGKVGDGDTAFGYEFTFNVPVKSFGGYILDADADEWYIIRYLLSDGTEIVDQIGHRNYGAAQQNCSIKTEYDSASDGVSKGFEYNVRSVTSNKQILRVTIEPWRMNHTGDPAFGIPNGDIPGVYLGSSAIGWAMDNFCIIAADAEPVQPLQITKSATPTTSATGEFSYTVTVTNPNSVAVDDVIVTDVSDEVLTEYIVPGSAQVSTGTLNTGSSVTLDTVWTFPTIAAGDSETLTYDILVPIPAPDSITDDGATNVASVYVDDDGDDIPDPEELDDTDDETVYIIVPEEGLTKTATLASVDEEEAVVNYTLTFLAEGRSYDGNLMIADVLDPKVEADWVTNISDNGEVNLFSCSDIDRTPCNNTIGWVNLSAQDGVAIQLTYDIIIPSSDYGLYENVAIAYEDLDDDDTPDPDDEYIDEDDAEVEMDIDTVVEENPVSGNLPSTALPDDIRMYVIAIMFMSAAAVVYKFGLGNEAMEEIVSVLGGGLKTAKSRTRDAAYNAIDPISYKQEKFEKGLLEKDK